MDLNSNQIQKIYVQLMGDEVGTWRPTTAFALGKGLFQILATPDYHIADEEWEFPPGSIVKCIEKKFDSDPKPETVLVAIKS